MMISYRLGDPVALSEARGTATIGVASLSCGAGGAGGGACHAETTCSIGLLAKELRPLAVPRAAVALASSKPNPARNLITCSYRVKAGQAGVGYRPDLKRDETRREEVTLSAIDPL